MFVCNMCCSRFHNFYKSNQDGRYCVWCYIALKINARSRI